MTSLADFKTSELVDQYNKASARLGDKPVKKFADRETAIRRTREQLIKFVRSIDEKLADSVVDNTTTLEDAVRHVATQPAKKAAKPAKAKAEKPAKKAAATERKVRQKHFVFKPLDEIRVPKADTLRGRAVALLKGGATLEEIEKLVKTFDKDRKKDQKNVERRAYELVRLIHYYLGYGLKQEDGLIFAYGA